MKRISAERKEAVIKKMLPPLSMSISMSINELVEVEGISRATLYDWRANLSSEGEEMSSLQRDPQNYLTAEAKLSVVIETIAMNETELSQYCREQGFYPQEVKGWKQACLDAQRSKLKQEREESAQSKADKQRIRELERELNRKEKALAETAALLVLRKKLNALWDDEGGEN